MILRQYIRILAFILLSMCLPGRMLAEYNQYAIDTRGGLSCMFVFSAYQQESGLMWFGTYDGLSIMSRTKQDQNILSSITNQFNGCYVEGISEGMPGHVWIRTNIGISLVDLSRHQVSWFPEVSGDYRYAVSGKDMVIALTKSEGFLYYNNVDGRFMPLPFQDIALDDFLFMHIGDDGKWTVVTRRQTLFVDLVTNGDGSVSTKLTRRTSHPTELSYVGQQDDQLFLVDVAGNVFRSDIQSGRRTRLGMLPPTLRGRANISAFLKVGKAYFISYYDLGAYELSQDQGAMAIRHRHLSCGVFRMHKDRHQPIVWMLTDGEGVKYLVEESFRIRSEIADGKTFRLSAPIRALTKDSKGNLWLGTKGGGIYRFEDYHPFRADARPNIRQFTTENSALLHNSVYNLAEDDHGVIWIGSDAFGLNYIRVATGEVHALALADHQLASVHGIEVDEDGLWIASENGMHRIRLAWNGDTPRAVSCQRVLSEKNQKGRLLVQDLKKDGNGFWMACRDYGLRHWDSRTQESTVVASGKDMPGVVTDVCSVIADQPGYIYCGTRVGLARCRKANPGNLEFVSDSLSVANQSVRSLHSAGRDEIWFTTHNEVVHYHPATGKVRYFTQEKGIDVMEYSDGASFYDAGEGISYFGGTNGFVAISAPSEDEAEYTPGIQFLCTDNNDACPRLYSQWQQDRITLDHDQGDCTLRFFIPDYIAGDAYVLEYRMDGDKAWKVVGSDNAIAFSNLSSQVYTVQVRYHKGSYVSDVTTITLDVLPPWYSSWWMKAVYFLCLAAAVYYMMWRYRRRLIRRQQYAIEESRQKARQEEYESKLQFFKNMAQQMSNPLMLIGGPCEQILYNGGLEVERARQYAQVIRDNARRLQLLLQQMMEIKLWNTDEQEAPDTPFVPQDTGTQKDSIDKEKYTVLLAEPDAQMSWFISDLLSGDYNIRCCQTSDEVMQVTESEHIDLIILDSALTPASGLEVCRRLKGDKSTNHIPLFILSNTDEDKAECMESGTQQFIQTPFDTRSFISTVRGQMKRLNNLKEYYNSAESSFDIFQGKKMHREDKELLELIYRIIQENLSDPNLSTMVVAEKAGIGVRNLYRKLEGLTDVMPKELIRDMRLTKAAKLLVTTKMSMEEVAYSVGYGNKGTFYKLFAERYGCTPKQYKEKQR